MSLFKYKYSIILISSFYLFIYSCKKSEEEANSNDTCNTSTTIHNISGMIYKDCNHNPDINRRVGFSVFESNTGHNLISGTVYTDSTGHFNYPANYIYSGCYGPVIHLAVLSDSIGSFFDMYNYPPDEIPTIISEDSVHLKLTLQVNNAYTLSDTLYIRINPSYTDYFDFLVGPFSNGVFSFDIPTSTRHSFTSETIQMRWGIGFNYSDYYFHNFNHTVCSPADSVTITIN
jgi:hypothetical protein